MNQEEEKDAKMPARPSVAVAATAAAPAEPGAAVVATRPGAVASTDSRAVLQKGHVFAPSVATEPLAPSQRLPPRTAAASTSLLPEPPGSSMAGLTTYSTRELPVQGLPPRTVAGSTSLLPEPTGPSTVGLTTYSTRELPAAASKRPTDDEIKQQIKAARATAASARAAASNVLVTPGPMAGVTTTTTTVAAAAAAAPEPPSSALQQQQQKRLTDDQIKQQIKAARAGASNVGATSSTVSTLRGPTPGVVTTVAAASPAMGTSQRGLSDAEIKQRVKATISAAKAAKSGSSAAPLPGAVAATTSAAPPPVTAAAASEPQAVSQKRLTDEEIKQEVKAARAAANATKLAAENPLPPATTTTTAPDVAVAAVAAVAEPSPQHPEVQQEPVQQAEPASSDAVSPPSAEGSIANLKSSSVLSPPEPPAPAPTPAANVEPPEDTVATGAATTAAASATPTPGAVASTASVSNLKRSFAPLPENTITSAAPPVVHGTMGTGRSTRAVAPPAPAPLPPLSSNPRPAPRSTTAPPPTRPALPGSRSATGDRPSLAPQSTRAYLTGRSAVSSYVLSSAGANQNDQTNQSADDVNQHHTHDFFKVRGYGDPQSRRPHKKFARVLVAITVVCLLVAAGVGVGVALGAGGGGDSGLVMTEGPTPAPTMTMTSVNEIRFRQTLEAIIPASFIEESPEAFQLALDWYANLDPSLQQESSSVTSTVENEWEQPHFLQRFILIWTWFHTTQLGTKPWASCNPINIFLGDVGDADGDVFEQGDTCDEQAFAGLNTFASGPVFETRSSIRYMSGRSECEWVHVTCDDESLRQVTSVNFLGNGMSGSHPFFLVLIPSLRGMDIWWHEELTGNLPTDLSTWTSLRRISVVGTPLGGPIPDQLYALTNLQEIVLVRTDLSGTISTEIEMLEDLVTFEISRNSGMSGSIPTEVGLLSQLEHLAISFLRLRRTPIPTEIGLLTMLTTLDLENNFLTGEIPESFVNLTKLEMLLLGTNVLEGTIPELFMPMASLLSLAENRLTGPIPETLYENEGTMETLFLRNNRLSGSLSESVGNFVALQSLQLQSNQFTGPIPEVLASLTNLNDVNLVQNEFMGTVPESICTLRSQGNLDRLQTDCLAFGELPAPTPCSCCTTCCSAKNGIGRFECV